jgi:hypothetical protein
MEKVNIKNQILDCLKQKELINNEFFEFTYHEIAQIIGIKEEKVWYCMKSLELSGIIKIIKGEMINVKLPIVHKCKILNKEMI